MLSPSLEQVQYMEAHIGDTKVPGIIVTTCICMPLVYIVVCLRFVSRRIGKVKLAANDWLILIAVSFLTAYTIACWVTVRYGMGKHSILVKDPKALAICNLIALCTYPCSLLAIKLSLISLYRQIFPLPWLQKLSIPLALFITAYSVMQLPISIFQCVPIKAIWDSMINAKCIDLAAEITVMSIMSIITDVIVLVLPIRPVWGLQMSRSKKWQLSLIFALGGCTCVVTAVRLIYIKRYSSNDATWDDVECGELSAIECCTGIIASSLPACRPLLEHLQNKLTTKRGKVNQKLIFSSNEDYRRSAGDASWRNNTNTRSDLDDEDERLYIALE